jgi:hypothetical protein
MSPEPAIREVRQATAFVSILALILHIAVMAFTAGRLPEVSREADGIHAHHGRPAADHNADIPKGDAAHKAQCCILSICPGLPGPPAGHGDACLPDPQAIVVVFSTNPTAAAPRVLLFRSVGARAPPVMV